MANEYHEYLWVLEPTDDPLTGIREPTEDEIVAYLRKRGIGLEAQSRYVGGLPQVIPGHYLIIRLEDE